MLKGGGAGDVGIDDQAKKLLELFSSFGSKQKQEVISFAEEKFEFCEMKRRLGMLDKQSQVSL